MSVGQILWHRESRERSIDWLVRSQFDNVPIQIGDRRFTAAVDTGTNYRLGVIIPYNAFVHLTELNFIKDAKLHPVANVDGTPVQSAMSGKGKVSLHDSEGDMRIFKMAITSWPAMRKEGSAVLSMDFVARFDSCSFYGKPPVFEGIVYK